MILSSLEIDSNPLIIEFFRDDPYYEVQLIHLDYYINDADKINKIMDYFINRCDWNKSPQSLFEIQGLNYLTLIKDFEENSDFDIVRDKIVKILGTSLTRKDKKYIKAINVSYPDTWGVHILEH